MLKIYMFMTEGVLAEQNLTLRVGLLLKKITKYGLGAFQDGPEFFKRSIEDGHAVGKFALKARPGVNLEAVKPEFRMVVSVPVRETGEIILDEETLNVAWCSLRSFLTPEIVGGEQRDPKEWVVNSGTGITDEQTGTTDNEIKDLLDTVTDSSLVVAGQTLIEAPDLEQEVIAALNRQLSLADRLNQLLGNYLELTRFDDIY
ncbi:hypothetical protein KC878_01050 [Candidatus Saccharibacteria bacterium]|nr:hypothetical protein [Candidatus Saccharibacteria bacterium]MCB9821151.1 hypothetical protein [Candidatus Nomurabacteria bacterium]